MRYFRVERSTGDVKTSESLGNGGFHSTEQSIFAHMLRDGKDYHYDRISETAFSISEKIYHVRRGNGGSSSWFLDNPRFDHIDRQVFREMEKEGKINCEPFPGTVYKIEYFNNKPIGRVLTSPIVGDILRLDTTQNGVRVYEVSGIYLGGEGQESIVTLKAIGRKPATIGSEKVEEMAVPLPILDSLLGSGKAQCYKRC